MCAKTKQALGKYNDCATKSRSVCAAASPLHTLLLFSFHRCTSPITRRSPSVPEIFFFSRFDSALILVCIKARVRLFGYPLHAIEHLGQSLPLPQLWPTASHFAITGAQAFHDARTSTQVSVYFLGTSRSHRLFYTVVWWCVCGT